MTNKQAVKDLDVLITSVENNEQWLIHDYEKEFYIGMLKAVIKYLQDKDSERSSSVKPKATKLPRPV